MSEQKIEPMMQDWEDAKRLLFGMSLNNLEHNEIAPLLERIACALNERSHVQQRRFGDHTWYEIEVIPPLEGTDGYADRRHHPYIFTVYERGQETAKRVYRDFNKFFPGTWRIELKKFQGECSFCKIAGNEPAQTYELHWGGPLDDIHHKRAAIMKKEHSRIIGGEKLPKVRKKK